MRFAPLLKKASHQRRGPHPSSTKQCKHFLSNPPSPKGKATFGAVALFPINQNSPNPVFTASSAPWSDRIQSSRAGAASQVAVAARTNRNESSPIVTNRDHNNNYNYNNNYNNNYNYNNNDNREVGGRTHGKDRRSEAGRTIPVGQETILFFYEETKKRRESDTGSPTERQRVPAGHWQGP